MAIERLNPPPAPSTPKDWPWEDVQSLIKRMDTLITLMGGAAPTPAGIPPQIVMVPGAPRQPVQLVTVLQEMVPESMGRSAVIPFQKTIGTAYQDSQDRQVPFTGTVKEVIISFPAGCQQLVEVRLIYAPSRGSWEYIVPSLDGSFVALDDVTSVFMPRYPVKAPGNFIVEWYNYDSLNSHTVPVIITVSPTGLEVR